MPIADCPANSRVRRVLRMSAILGALASSSACLSLSIVPKDDDEPESDAGADAGGDGEHDAGHFDAGLDAGERDASEPDAGVGERDADVETDPPCIDRGTYVVGVVEVKGLANACNDDLVCVAGKCVEPPSCTEGVTSACVFRPEGAHGQIMVQQMEGDYLYWIEFGSYDERGNYLANGAVARAKVGTWRREELATSLFFLAPGDHQLKVEGDFVFAQVGIALNEEFYRTYRMSSSTLGQTAILDTHFNTASLARSCTFGGQQYWNEGNKTYRRSLTNLESVEELIPQAQFARRTTCVVGDGFLVMNDEYDTHFYLAPSASADGTWRPIPADGATIIGLYGDKLVARRFDWILTATADVTSTTVSWTNVAGGGNQVIMTTIQGDYGYWSDRSVIARGKLDGTGTQQVVAELHTWPVGTVFSVSDAGAAWFDQWQGHFRFAPLPPP